ncbi:hypothetical protein E2C01_028294 [Portunus trituberculatus]|uniref:Uncharacterized protein n=1 Tax=Portunus trituberculatus TaxID=210409 RepID=A0A5B7EK94_PORTR|nr:hypothetical protein [Portunus trituberculatus]
MKTYTEKKLIKYQSNDPPQWLLRATGRQDGGFSTDPRHRPFVNRSSCVSGNWNIKLIEQCGKLRAGINNRAMVGLKRMNSYRRCWAWREEGLTG